MRLYDYLDSGNGYKVRLLLALLGRPYERVELDIDQGETRTPEFLEKNPNGRIPALELDDGEVLCESDAILFYLAEGTPYLPEERLERARVLQWMFFEQYSHEPYVAVNRYIARHLAADHPRQAEIAERRPRGEAALAVMETHLAGREFFVGERCTIADIALYAYTHVAGDGGYDLGPFVCVRRWLERVAARPGHVEMLAG